MSIPTSRQIATDFDNIQALHAAVVALEARVTALDGGVPPARSGSKKAADDDDDEAPARSKKR